MTISWMRRLALLTLLFSACDGSSTEMNSNVMPTADVGMVLTDGERPSSDRFNEMGPRGACISRPCGPYGTCVEGECVCDEGFALVEGVCVDVNECTAEIPVCGPRALCTNLPGHYECTCAAGFKAEGDDCVDIDECASLTDNCSDSAACINQEGTFQCTCQSGFEGDGVTCTDVDECAAGLHDCGANAYCRNVVGGFQCGCVDGWVGDGRLCEDVDECAAGIDNCSEHAACLNTEGHFECACDAGFVGDGVVCADENECDNGVAQCDVNADCQNTMGGFECTCRGGWMGDGAFCADIDECRVGPGCDAVAECVNAPGAYHCVCPDGFQVDGPDCRDVNECERGIAQCGFRSECINTYGSFRCVCASGFFQTADGCVDVDECAMGVFDCHRFADCRNTTGAYICDCSPGFVGDGALCEDIDECALGLTECPDNAQCINLPGTARCECRPGFELVDDICVNIDECARGLDDCDQAAECEDADGGFVCTCLPGYAGNGQVCEDVDECAEALDECPEELPCRNIPGAFVCGSEAIYVCDCDDDDAACTPGNDMASGEVPNEAWRTLSRVSEAARGGNLPAGAVIRLCNGGVFTEGLTIRTSWQCSAERPCVITGYSTPAHPESMPTILGRLVVDGDPAPDVGGFLEIRDLRITPREVVPAIALAPGTRSVTLANLHTSGPGSGIVIGDQENGHCGPMECPKPQNVTVEGSVITDHGGDGIWVDGHGVRIERNLLQNNGLITGRPQIYIQCIDGASCHRQDVRGNTVLVEDRFDLETCRTPQIRIEGVTEASRILENRVDIQGDATFGCAGILFDRGPARTRFQNAVVSRNTVINPGDYAVAMSSCEDCIIENNALSMNRETFGIAINAPVRRGFGEHAILERLAVRHNSIYMGDRVRSTSIAIKVTGSGRGHRLTGNAIVNLSSGRTTCCFDQALDVTIYDEHDANVCLLSEDNAFANWALGFNSLESWQNATGFDQTSIEGNPGFVRPAPPIADFRIASPDALVVDRSLPRYAPPVDRLGTDRDERPDSGAFEHGSGDEN